MQIRGTRQQVLDQLKSAVNQHEEAHVRRSQSDLVGYTCSFLLVITLILTFVIPWLIGVDLILVYFLVKGLVGEEVMGRLLDPYKVGLLQACLEVRSDQMDPDGDWHLVVDSQGGVPQRPPGEKSGQFPWAHSWGRLSIPLRKGGTLEIELRREGQVAFARSRGAWLSHAVGSDRLLVRAHGEEVLISPLPRMVSPREVAQRLLQVVFVGRLNLQPALRFTPREALFRVSDFLPGAELVPPPEPPANAWMRAGLLLGLSLVTVAGISQGLNHHWRQAPEALVSATPVESRFNSDPFDFVVSPGATSLKNPRDNGFGNWAGEVNGGVLIIDGWSGKNLGFYSKVIERNWTGGSDYKSVQIEGIPGRRTRDTLWLSTPRQTLRVVYSHPDAAQVDAFFQQLKVVPRLDPQSRDFQIQWPPSAN